MKYTFKKNDEYEARRIVKADDMAIALFDIQLNLQKRCEHATENMDKYATFEHIFNEIHLILNRWDIDTESILE